MVAIRSYLNQETFTTMANFTVTKYSNLIFKSFVKVIYITTQFINIKCCYQLAIKIKFECFTTVKVEFILFFVKELIMI